MLENEKLELEKEKLAIENENSREARQSWLRRFLVNLPFLTTVILGAWGLFRYLEGRRAELRNRHEERFERVVKSLGSEQAEERVSASVLLSSFLSQEYKRFHEQVFNLAAGHLRAEADGKAGAAAVTKVELPAAVSKVELTMGPPISPAAFNAPDSAEIRSPPSPSPLAQTLANVLSRSYRLARDARKREGNLASLTRQFLNAAGVRLDGTYLAHTDFKNAWLRQASFRGTNLSSAHLTGAVLEGSNMSEADLTEAELVGANLRFVDFTKADLTGAGLDGADIEHADFTEAIMKKVTMIGGTAAGANFRYADLTNARFEGVDFYPTEPDGRPANPEAAKSLESATFKDVKGLSEKQVRSCKEKGAQFVAESNLAITSVVPSMGMSSGGSRITITGVNFKTPTVKFGSVSAPVDIVEGSTVIYVVAPPHEPQTVDITVINIDGKTATMEKGFTYV